MDLTVVWAIIIAFAVANRQTVTVSLDPFSAERKSSWAMCQAGASPNNRPAAIARSAVKTSTTESI